MRYFFVLVSYFGVFCFVLKALKFENYVRYTFLIATIWEHLLLIYIILQESLLYIGGNTCYVWKLCTNYTNAWVNNLLDNLPDEASPGETGSAS